MQLLDGAYERVNRASEHLIDLKHRVDILSQKKMNTTFIELQPDFADLLKIRIQGNLITGFTNEPRFTEPIISILTGEIIYNLRAALDYLVYELACFDSKQVVEDTQFPIEDSEETFNKARIGKIDDKRRKGVYLRGVSDVHIAAIKQLQPCDGCQWTKYLRTISNPDKHMRLTIINSPISFVWSRGNTELTLAQETMNMYNGMSIQVVFSDGMPVIETLDALQSQVSTTIDAFYSEFK